MRNSIYPVIKGQMGPEVAKVFIGGLQNIGIGEYNSETKSFKRHMPQNFEEAQQLRKKFKLFGIEYPPEDDNFE